MIGTTIIFPQKRYTNLLQKDQMTIETYQMTQGQRKWPIKQIHYKVNPHMSMRDKKTSDYTSHEKSTKTFFEVIQITSYVRISAIKSS